MIEEIKEKHSKAVEPVDKMVVEPFINDPNNPAKTLYNAAGRRRDGTKPPWEELTHIEKIESNLIRGGFFKAKKKDETR